MAFTNFGYFNNASGGAPSLSGTAGDLHALIRYAGMTISNWTSSFNTGSPTFATVLAFNGGAVTTPLLSVQDNATTSGDARAAVVRLVEAASSSTAYTDPIPTVTQVANASANWIKSTTASAATREYHCVVWETGILLAVKAGNVANTWDWYFAGKCWPRFAIGIDPYPWAITTRNSSSYTTQVGVANASAYTQPAASAGLFFAMRHAGGVIKSEYLNPEGRGNALGIVAGAAVVGAGFQSGLEKGKIYLMGNGGSTTVAGGSPILSRLRIPHIWQGLASGYSGVTETDNVNDGSNTGQMLRFATTGGHWMLTSNTDPGY